MTERTFKIFAGFPAYAGNGGYSAVLPKIMFWWHRTYYAMRNDPSIEKVFYEEFCDTPIPMVRNQMVKHAKALGADYLLMVDSDNAPDIEPGGKEFWPTSWEFLKKHYDKGPALIFAPYCGTPTHEVPYVFKWATVANEDAPEKFSLEMMNREEAALWSGIVDVAAGPTGLMLIDMRVFDLIDPPYFQYEYKDATQSEKASTEDVYFTRNASLNGIVKLGYNPLYCNFDSWAGHAKQKMVRKPRPLSADAVAETLSKAVLSRRQSGEQLIVLGENANKDENGREYKPKNRLIEPGTKVLGTIDLDALASRQLHLRPNTQDGVVLEEVVNQNCYKLPEQFPAGAVVLDVGAHIGIFALECVKRGAAEVYCFEPEPENFALLRANTRHEPKIKSFNVAVWNDKPVELVIRPSAYTAQHYVQPSTNGHAVNSMTLDDILLMCGGKAHLLKLDCEGAEQPILESATCLENIERIVMEVHSEVVNKAFLQDVLNENGFYVGGRVSVAQNEIWFCDRQNSSPLIRLIQELKDELGEAPNVVTIEPNDGTAAIEAADAGAMVYTVRAELTQEFKDAAGQRLGDTIDVLVGNQWTSAHGFLATAHMVVFAGCYDGFIPWKQKASHILCGTEFDDPAIQPAIKALPGEFESDGDFWFKRIGSKQPVTA